MAISTSHREAISYNIYWGYPFNRSDRGQQPSTDGSLAGARDSAGVRVLAAARAAPPEAPLDGDEVLVAHRGVGEGELENPVEHHSASAGAAAVETEHELVRLPLTPVKWIPP